MGLHNHVTKRESCSSSSNMQGNCSHDPLFRIVVLGVILVILLSLCTGSTFSVSFSDIIASLARTVRFFRTLTALLHVFPQSCSDICYFCTYPFILGFVLHSLATCTFSESRIDVRKVTYAVSDIPSVSPAVNLY